MRTHFLVLISLLVLSLGTTAAAVVTPPQVAAAIEPAPAVEPSELLPNGSQPLPDILTGGQPSLEQFEEAHQLGYETVINLRTDEEMTDGSAGRKAIETMGMTYISLPIASADDLDRDAAELFAAALADAEGPTIVHCKSGNRVGALFALKAFYFDGASAEEALELGRSAGLTRLEPVVRQRLEE